MSISMCKHMSDVTVYDIAMNNDQYCSMIMNGYVKYNKSMSSKSTYIPCTPMPVHAVCDVHVINEVVDMGICSITLTWIREE